MICKNCGIEYTGNFCPNGCDSPDVKKKLKKPLYKKWWFWLIVALLFIGVASSSGNSNEEPSVNDPLVNSTTVAPNHTDSQDTGAPSSDVSTQSTTEPSRKEAYDPGEGFQANGLQISYLKAENWAGYSQYNAPDDGYMYIRLLLSAENTANTDRYISSFEFTCYADGKKMDMYYLADDILSGGTLSAGRKTEGYLYFMVPINASEIEVEYETNFWTGKKAILRVCL